MCVLGGGGALRLGQADMRLEGHEVTSCELPFELCKALPFTLVSQFFCSPYVLVLNCFAILALLAPYIFPCTWAHSPQHLHGVNGHMEWVRCRCAGAGLVSGALIAARHGALPGENIHLT